MPHDIRISQVTSSSFKIQFSPSFDGGAGPQRFLLEVILKDQNKTINDSVLHQQLPFHTYEYTVKGKRFVNFLFKFQLNAFELDLNESTLYVFRLKASNIYGESPWSDEQSVQTLESIVTPDGKNK